MKLTLCSCGAIRPSKSRSYAKLQLNFLIHTERYDKAARKYAIFLRAILFAFRGY